jgi:hypothetical protein
MKKIGIIASASLIVLMAAVPAFASNQNNGSGTRQYGPFTSGSPDSGTCGNDWANDTYKRVFTVNRTNPNIVTEEFKDGHFVTVAGASPGGCDTNVGGTVGAGVKGTFSGTFTIVVTGGTYNQNAACTQATCGTTAGFISTVYGPTAVYDIPTFEFHYKAGKNGAWTNASADKGGNKGDITGNPKPKGDKGDKENDNEGGNDNDSDE